MVEATLAQVYIVIFSMLLFAAPALVGIITPLVTPIITSLEKMRLKKLEELREEASKLAKVSEDEELREAKKRLEKATEKYQNVKNLTRYLDISIICGILVPLFCLAGILEIFSSGEVTIALKLYLVLALLGFIIESFCLLTLIAVHVKSIRKKIVEELDVGRKPAEKLEIIPDDEAS